MSRQVIQRNLLTYSALTMLEGYANRYMEEDFQIVELDIEFSGAIRNPKTGSESRTFRMAGKANGIVRINDELFCSNIAPLRVFAKAHVQYPMQAVFNSPMRAE